MCTGCGLCILPGAFTSLTSPCPPASSSDRSKSCVVSATAQPPPPPVQLASFSDGSWRFKPNRPPNIKTGTKKNEQYQS